MYRDHTFTTLIFKQIVSHLADCMYDMLTLGDEGGVVFSLRSGGIPDGDIRLPEGGEPEVIRTGIESSRSIDSDMGPFS
jgi:hypothetical protein